MSSRIPQADSARWCQGCVDLARQLGGQPSHHGSMWTQIYRLQTRFGGVSFICGSMVFHYWYQTWRFESPQQAPPGLLQYNPGYFSWVRTQELTVDDALAELRQEVKLWLPG